MTPVTRFPAEFEELLSPDGRAVLNGTHPACGALRREPFYSDTGLLDAGACASAVALLTRHFEDLLVPNVRRLPPATATKVQNEENLPKVGLMYAVPMSGPGGEQAVQRAEACGLLAMVSSRSYRAFCEALAGRALDGPQTGQIFAYRRGGYAGPHTDHHPEEPRMVNGYVDVHLTFCTAGVREQRIVYERDGHFTEQRSIAESGSVTAYRLPMWHYTTPLVTGDDDDCRWLVLGSFFDA